MISKNNKQFNVFLPRLELRKYIQYYNIIFPENDTFMEKYSLMPNACGTISLSFNGFIVNIELWGASKTPILLGLEPNSYKALMLIQLSPYGLYQIIRQNQANFTDKRLLLEDIDNLLYNSLLQVFLVSENIAELVNACDEILYKRMKKHIVSNALILATNVITDTHGQIRVKEIASQSSYSERQLNRLFLTQIGMSTKDYARLIRFHYVLKNIQKSHYLFAALSQKAGYFDQAHFDKDFKAISGLTPQKFLHTMSDFYYDDTDIYNTISTSHQRRK